MEFRNMCLLVGVQGNTLTTGTNAYMIAIMENGNWRNFQVIRGDSEEEAVNKYNILNKYIGISGMCVGPVRE